MINESQNHWNGKNTDRPQTQVINSFNYNPFDGLSNLGIESFTRSRSQSYCLYIFLSTILVDDKIISHRLTPSDT